MPKIKDLGIKVIPETMRPPEIGGGGGCTDCTVQAFSICGGTHGGGGGGCTDCTVQAFSICGGSPGGGGCTDCTLHPFSLCGGSIQRCWNATVRPCWNCSFPWHSFIDFACGPHSLPCGAFTNCGAASPVCAVSMDPTIFQQGGITREQIAALKESLRNQIAALEEHEKYIGPKTAEEISAREKQLNEELDDLKARRKSLKK